MNNLHTLTDTMTPLKPTETWQRDPYDADLWHGPNGVIVNTAALKEREFYFDVIRVESYKLAS